MPWVMDKLVEALKSSDKVTEMLLGDSERRDVVMDNFLGPAGQYDKVMDNPLGN